MDTDQFCESFTELYDRWNLVCKFEGEFDLQEILDNLQHLGIENPLDVLRNGGEGTPVVFLEDLQTEEGLLQQAIWLCEDRMKRDDEIPLGWEGKNYPFHPIRNAGELKEWLRDSHDELLSAEDRSRPRCCENGTEIIRNAFHAFYSLGIESPAQPKDPSDGHEAVRIIRNLLVWLRKQVGKKSSRVGVSSLNSEEKIAVLALALLQHHRFDSAEQDFNESPATGVQLAEILDWSSKSQVSRVMKKIFGNNSMTVYKRMLAKRDVELEKLLRKHAGLLNSHV